MKCTQCGGATEVVDTQKYDTLVWRRRRCTEVNCDFRFSTHETFVETKQVARLPGRPRLQREPKPEPEPKPTKPNITALPVVNKRRLIESLREELERKRRDECDEDIDSRC